MELESVEANWPGREDAVGMEERGQIMEMSPLQMLIRLYEGAIGFLEQASDAIGDDDIEAFKHNLKRGSRIIEEFQKTLNFQDGGQVSAQLNDLYAFMLDSLKQAELTHQPEYVHRVLTHLETLLDGWRGAQPIVEG